MAAAEMSSTDGLRFRRAEIDLVTCDAHVVVALVLVNSCVSAAVVVINVRELSTSRENDGCSSTAAVQFDQTVDGISTGSTSLSQDVIG